MSKQIEAVATGLVTGEQGEQQAAFLTGTKEGQHHLFSVDNTKIGKEEEECYSSIYSQGEPIASTALKADLSGVFLASNKNISLLDLEKQGISTTFEHKA